MKQAESPPAQGDRYLNLAAVAHLAGVHRATVYRWLADPALTLKSMILRLPSGRIRIQESRFRTWLESQNGGARPAERSGS